MLNIVYNGETANLSSMKVIGGSVKMFVNIETKEDLELFVKSLSEEEVKNIFVIGDGTNTIFLRENREMILIKLGMKEIFKSKDTVEVGANINWDEFVKIYMKLGGLGMELLSKIPGTVGAAPVQNIGAYGQEVSNFIEGVKVFDLQDRQFKVLKNSECEFEYRSSIFKKEKNRYIIYEIVFKILNFPVRQTREEIIILRESKLPDPKIVANCGSFFKNLFLNNDELERVKTLFPDIPVFTHEKNFKIPIAYVLEKLGFKNFNPDFTNGNFGTYRNHALVIISNGKGEGKEFLEFVDKIKKAVFEKTGLIIEEEVNLV